MVNRILQQTFLKMNRFALTLHFAFIASILLAGCAAPAHLAQESEPTQDEKMQQTIDRWKGAHISKAIQKWGTPKEVTDDGTGWQTYIWEVPVEKILVVQEHRVFTRRYPNGLPGVMNRSLSTDYAYEITFYARPNGVIAKTDIKKSHDHTSELGWK